MCKYDQLQLQLQPHHHVITCDRSVDIKVVCASSGKRPVSWTGFLCQVLADITQNHLHRFRNLYNFLNLLNETFRTFNLVLHIKKHIHVTCIVTLNLLIFIQWMIGHYNQATNLQIQCPQILFYRGFCLKIILLHSTNYRWYA